MATKSTYELMKEMQSDAELKANPAKAPTMHPDTIRRVFEMQQEKVPCMFCSTITKTDVHVDYNDGMSVYTKYVCPNCTHTFMEKDLYVRNI